MKKKLHYKIIVLLLSLTVTSGWLKAQSYSASESFSKSSAVPEGINVVLNNYSADLVINTTNENVISIKTEIKVNGKSKEDVEMVFDAIKNLEFELHGNTFEIDTRFYKNMMNIGFKSTMTLLNGEKVNIKDFEVQHEINIPKSSSLDFENKYGDVDMGDFEGKANFDLYSTTIHGGDIGSNSKMAMKYSKIFMGNLKDVEFDLYDTDVVFENCGDINIESKYSKVEGKKAGSLVVDSYDDKFKISAISNAKIDAKYSDFEFSSDLGTAELDFYDSNFSAGNANKCSYSGKYSELIFKDVKEVNIPESYDDKFSFGKTKEIKVTESKYSDYYINQADAFYLVGYDDNITIEGLAGEFNGPVNVDGKYIKLNIDSENKPFQLHFNIKYPKIDIPDDVQIIKQIEKSSTLELVGNNSGGEIIVTGYDMNVIIK